MAKRHSLVTRAIEYLYKKLERWNILIGTRKTDSAIRSTYAFCEQVVGYDLEGFFTRNSAILREEVDKVLKALLTI